MPTVSILGGGVAGLALAATLDPTAYDVTLIERNPGYTRVPTAFGIWPFALAALERIKLADEVRGRGLLLTSGVITADSARRPVTMTKQNANTWLITRPALLRLLDESVPTTVEREQRHVDDATTLSGDLVVAADGARSVVRRQVWGDQPRDTGVVAIRGVLETPPDTPLVEDPRSSCPRSPACRAHLGRILGPGCGPGTAVPWWWPRSRCLSRRRSPSRTTQSVPRHRRGGGRAAGCRRGLGVSR
jgi:2-polyprenyl-6-methoxyphenol hydroxylase-like FAD-dependent oxidoreductase